MAYIDQSNSRRHQAAAIASVAIVHALVGFGLVVGMTVVGVAPPIHKWKPFILTPERPTTPPPEAKPAERTTSSVTVVPTPPIDVATTDPVDRVVIDQRPIDNGYVIDNRPIATPAPVPPISPGFTPRKAKPANNRAEWIRNDDYPSSAIRSEAQGIAGYRLVIGTNGRVSACEITSSTGNAQLDKATCRLIQNRARFEPATDTTGAKVLGTYTGTVSWELPD